MSTETLKPFNLEEAKKHPERVRYVKPIYHGAPKHCYFVDDIIVLRSQYSDDVSESFTPAEAEKCLRLVKVEPKQKHYRLTSSITSRNDPVLVNERSHRFGYPKDDRVLDVTYDKATGIITVTYDE